MKISAIAHSYWRLIKAGKRTFDSVPDTMKDQVKELAKTDVENGVITREEYKDYIGEEFPET
jgi:hypothetical protein